MYKTIGIIGGMGPAATCDLMSKIIEMTDASCDQEHIPMIIDSNTRIPDRTAAIISGGSSPVPELVSSAARLAAAGADLLIMPCNTAHYFIRAVESAVDIPVLNMPLLTAQLLRERNITQAAVLATDGTVQSGLYENALIENDIQAIYPDSGQQEVIMSLIYDYIKKGITSRDKLPCDAAASVVDDLKQRGAEAVILACTELPLAFEAMDLMNDDCIDPTRVLATAAITEAGGILAKNSS